MWHPRGGRGIVCLKRNDQGVGVVREMAMVAAVVFSSSLLKVFADDLKNTEIERNHPYSAQPSLFRRPNGMWMNVHR